MKTTRKIRLNTRYNISNHVFQIHINTLSIYLNLDFFDKLTVF